jgi:hypothetical protein
MPDATVVVELIRNAGFITSKKWRHRGKGKKCSFGNPRGGEGYEMNRRKRPPQRSEDPESYLYRERPSSGRRDAPGRHFLTPGPWAPGCRKTCFDSRAINFAGISVLLQPISVNACCFQTVDCAKSLPYQAKSEAHACVLVARRADAVRYWGPDD